MYQIEKYTTSTGECPIDDFIEELNKAGQKKQVDKIDAYVRLLKEMGLNILSNSHWAKDLEDGIYELRPKSNRILFTSVENKQKFVLLHGFKKKTQKTPPCEIERAKKERNNYRRNSWNENKGIWFIRWS